MTGVYPLPHRATGLCSACAVAGLSRGLREGDGSGSAEELGEECDGGVRRCLLLHSLQVAHPIFGRLIEIVQRKLEWLFPIIGSIETLVELPNLVAAMNCKRMNNFGPGIPDRRCHMLTLACQPCFSIYIHQAGMLVFQPPLALVRIYLH
jgi:hypothetical protein